jgi:hypothetical protein
MWRKQKGPYEGVLCNARELGGSNIDM